MKILVFSTMRNPETHSASDFLKGTIPFERKVTQDGPWLTIALGPPPGEIKEFERPQSEEEKIFENVASFIENPERRSERWEKFLAHSKKAFDSFVHIDPEGKLISVDGKKETLGLYIEDFILKRFPEAAAALIRAAQEKFGRNAKIIVGPTAEKSDIPLSQEVSESLNNRDNVLFVIGLSKQRAVSELWHLEKRTSKAVLDAMSWDPGEMSKQAALFTFVDDLAREEGYDIARYLKRLKPQRPKIGMFALRKEEALLDPTFEDDPREIQARLDTMARHFKDARKVVFTSKDGRTNLTLDALECPSVGFGPPSEKSPFGAIPLRGHFGFNPNDVEGTLLANLHLGKIDYTTEKFPDLKLHPVRVEFKEGRITQITGTDAEAEKVATALRETYTALEKIVKKAGGDPTQVYQVVEFGCYVNPTLTTMFENQTREKYVKGGDFRICETVPHLGTCGSYNMPNAKGDLKELKGTTVHIDIMWDGFYEGQGKIEIEYKNGSKKTIMEDGKWSIF